MNALSPPRVLCCILICAFSLLKFPVVFASSEAYVIDDFTNVDIVVPTPDIVTVDVSDSKLLVSVSCVDRETGVIRIPLKRKMKDQKLRLHVSMLDDRLSYTGKFETYKTGKPIPKTFQQYFLDNQKSPLNYWLNDRYYEDVSFWFVCRKTRSTDPGVVRIDRLEIAPIRFDDERDFAYVLAAVVLPFFLVPGFLCYCAFFKPRGKEYLLLLVTPLSVCCFLGLYAVLLVAQQWSYSPGSWLLLVTYGALNVALLAWLAAKQRLESVVDNFLKIKWELLAVLIVMLCVTAIVTSNLDLAIYTMSHKQLRFLTYGARGAHDSMFQYVNGIALLHGEPFYKYYGDYGNYKLINPVNDRGIIAGAMYAAVRGVAAPLHTDIAYSYGLYALFGATLNVLVLLPVFALHRYYFAGRERTFLILFLLCTSPFLVTNFYLIWFKLAGAGLVISGLMLLLLQRQSIRAWIAVGIIWGLAANFHASLALGFPILTLWLLYRFWRARGRQVIPVGLAAGGLMAAFVAVMAPWETVKSIHFEDDKRLFREHFLGSEPYDAEGGMIGTIANFADRHPLQEQVETRLERLWASFRTDEIAALIEVIGEVSWQKVLIKWNQLEAAYTLLVFAAPLLLFLLSSLLTRLAPGTSWNQPVTAHRSDFLWLLGTQVLTILLLILVTYSNQSPDLTWHMPLSAIVIVLYGLVHANIAIGRIGLAVICVYSAFVYFRLFFQYF